MLRPRDFCSLQRPHSPLRRQMSPRSRRRPVHCLRQPQQLRPSKIPLPLPHHNINPGPFGLPSLIRYYTPSLVPADPGAVNQYGYVTECYALRRSGISSAACSDIFRSIGCRGILLGQYHYPIYRLRKMRVEMDQTTWTGQAIVRGRWYSRTTTI